MESSMSWRMPAPPPIYVLSVHDEDGREWTRVAENGYLWRNDIVVQSWDWLLYHRGVITAGRMAA